METTYLQEYVRVADCGSFTAAARELHLTQSTLSKHVAALEREFGVDLFVRSREGIRLTRAGKLLYAQALQFGDLFNKTKSLIRAAGEDAESARAFACGAGDGSARRGGAAPDGFPGGEDSPDRDTALRCKCRRAAEKLGLDEREAGALILYLEERGFEAIQSELGIDRNEVGAVLGGVYRKLGAGSKQDVLDFIHSVSE